MSKYRRFLLLLAAAVFCTALTACGSKSEPAVNDSSSGMSALSEASEISYSDVSESSSGEISESSSGEIPEISPDDVSEISSADGPAYVIADLPSMEVQLTNADIVNDTLLPMEGTSGVLVVYVGFTDGYVCDRELLENSFAKYYKTDECLLSVRSYYRLNSGGRVDFDFHFAYYDCPMTGREAWAYVEGPDEVHGDIIGNDFFIDIFEKVRANYSGDFSELDKDRDGWVDCSIFIFGDDSSKNIVDGWEYHIYGNGSRGALNGYRGVPDVNNPGINAYLKLNYDYFLTPFHYDEEPSTGNTRVAIHELGHMFGLKDYYDSYPYEGETTDTLGTFDMQSHNTGDWNVYSKMCCGWLKPYVITEDIQEITLKLGCSSLTNEAVLIPTSKGWNQTPYDEYIMIDVMAPEGANGFDWTEACDPRLDPSPSSAYTGQKGGVRIYHVDSRLVIRDLAQDTCTALTDFSLIPETKANPDKKIWYAFVNSNGSAPYLPEYSQFWHQIDLIPRSGSSKFRLCTPIGWATYTPFHVKDLFRTGDVFSMETCADAFPDAPYMNNGGTLDYEVRAESYDEETHEAVITITKIR